MNAPIPDSMLVGEARERFFSELEYEGGGGYSEKWFRLKLGPVFVPLPNTKSRVQAVRFHDLHHVATGYRTSWIGEAEIGAWELASGCQSYWTARFLDLSAFAVGLVLSPSRVFRAFVRGRYSSNLYSESFDEDLLRERLGDLRSRLGLQHEVPQASWTDRVAFTGWVLLALAMLLPLALLVWGLSVVL